jgi:hypothetical protein
MIVETAICLGASSVLALAKKARRKAKTNAAIRRVEQIEHARLAVYRRALADRYGEAERSIEAIAEQRNRERRR